MMDFCHGWRPRQNKMRVRTILPVVAVAFCLQSAGYAAAAPAGSVEQLSPQVTQLLDSADKAIDAGNVGLALVQLKNAVLIAPTSGEVRARFGVALERNGQAVDAERELRQSLKNYAPYALVVPALVRAMVKRSEFKELLMEFPDPSDDTRDKWTVDVLGARAVALQSTKRPKEARAAIDRSLAMRRDLDGLLVSVRLAQEQGDLVLARTQTDECLKLAPSNELALSSSVLLFQQSGDKQKALAAADEFVKRLPDSDLARIQRIELLLQLQQDAKAQLDVDALIKKASKSAFGHYYNGVLMARANNYKGAWEEVQSLQPEFVQFQSQIAIMVAGIAASSGHPESANAILTGYIARFPRDPDARVMLAATTLMLNAPQSTLDTLAPIRTSNDPIVHALLAQAYLQLKRYDQAIASLEIASASPQSSELVKQQLAQTRLQIGESDKGIQGLAALVQRDPGNPVIAGPLITALMGESKWNEALSIADKMAKQTPNSPFPEFYRGQVLAAQGNLPASTAAFTKALSLDPKFTPALYYRANVSIEGGKLEEGKKDLALIVSQNPGNMPAYMRLAQIALDGVEDQEALTWLDRAKKAAPKDPTPRLALANYQAAHGKYQDAQSTLTELLQVAQNNPQALILQGQIQLLRGQTPDAAKTFRLLVSTNPNSSVGYELLSKALYAAKDQQAAEDAAKKAADLTPSSAALRMSLIQLQIAIGKSDNALTTAQAYGKAYPGTDADMLMADTLLGLKRTSEAEAILQKSLSVKPDSRLVVQLRQIALGSGDTKKAIAIVADWTAKNPNDFAMQKDHAGLLMSAGDLDGARKKYEVLLKQHPDDPTVLNNIGLLVEKDDPARALSLLTAAVKAAPGSAEIADSLGWIKYQRQDHQGALPLLQRAHEMSATNPVISYHLALVLEANGKRTEAKSLLQATLATNSNFDGADDAKKLLTRW